MNRKYILHIGRDYSFEILRPLQSEILARGDKCVWYRASEAVNSARFKDDENVISDIDEISRYPADAVFTPGNSVPSFLQGLKVQVFHGLEWKKKGHFRIRDFFDLYCTHGPITTEKFNELASKHKNFLVRETGWPKLDPLFSTRSFELPTDRKVVLYAPTFSPSLSSAFDCFEEIIKLSKEESWYWIIKFHPMMDQDVVKRFKSAQHQYLKVIEGVDVLPLMQRADVMLSDTSSVIGEFQLLGKPVVTYRNFKPDTGLIDVSKVSQLKDALTYALSAPDDLSRRIQESIRRLHPYRDAKSSSRVLNVVEEILDNHIRPRKKRPRNLYRNYKLNKALGYKPAWLKLF